MINIEKYYKQANLIALYAVAFYLGLWVAGAAPLYKAILILIIPTTAFLVVVCGALLWSFILTRNNNELRSNN